VQLHIEGCRSRMRGLSVPGSPLGMHSFPKAAFALMALSLMIKYRVKA